MHIAKRFSNIQRNNFLLNKKHWLSLFTTLKKKFNWYERVRKIIKITMHSGCIFKIIIPDPLSSFVFLLFTVEFTELKRQVGARLCAVGSLFVIKLVLR